MPWRKNQNKTEHGAEFLIPSPNWHCWPFSSELSSPGFHGNILVLLFFSSSVSMKRTDLYSFSSPDDCFCLFSPYAFSNLPFHSSVSAVAPQTCVRLDLSTTSVTVPLGCPKGAPNQVSKGNLCSKRAPPQQPHHHSQSAQDRSFAVMQLSPPSYPSAEEELRFVNSASLDSVFFSPFPLSPSRPGHCHLVPGLLQ